MQMVRVDGSDSYDIEDEVEYLSRKPKALVVDDDEGTRYSLKKSLTKTGFDVTAVPDVPEAAEELSRAQFEVAFIDRILTHGHNGLDVVRMVRKWQPYCQPILISGQPSFASAAEAIRDDIYAYLCKPLSKSDTICTAVKALRESIRKREFEHYERLFHSLFHHSPNAIAICDLSGEVRHVNPAFARLFGYEKENVRGRIAPYVPDWDRERSNQDLEKVVNGETVAERETVRLGEDHHPIPVSLSLSICPDALARPSDILVIMRDLSQSKLIEKQLRQSQRLEAVGIMASRIAHELNNILTPVHAYAELAASKGSTGIARELEKIQAAAMRGKALLKNLLSFVRPESTEKVEIDMALPVRESLALLRHMLPSEIEVADNIRHDCGSILANPAQIQQIVLNLCTNAFHAMISGSGVLRVELDEVRLENGNGNSGLKAGRYVRLCVGDTGHGMDRKTLEHIFDPFFSTKAPEEGTGLGLSIVRSIVSEHGGIITVESEPGYGSTFYVHLPRIEDVV